MIDDDAYEIIYENGVPVIAFLICADDNESKNTDTEKETDAIVHVMSESEDDENTHTLQYFHEDDTEKTSSSMQTFCKNKPKQKSSQVASPKKQEECVKQEAFSDDLKFIIVEHATKCNSKKLYDRLGYSYTLRNVSVREGSSFWRCRFKVDNKECGGKIRVTRDNQFMVLQDHRHPPDTSVSFAELLQTGKQRLKANQPGYVSTQPTGKNIFKSHTAIKTAKGKQSTNSNTKNSPRECEKILDYFSESCNLDDSQENEAIILEEQENNMTDSESSNVEPNPDDALAPLPDSQVFYRVIKNGSLTGTHVLYDSLGYSYTIPTKKGSKTVWKCQAVLSSEGKECGSHVKQVGSNFTLLTQHSHSPKRHTLLKINKMEIFSSQEKEGAKHPVKRSLSQIDESPPKKIKKEKSTNDKNNFLTVNNIESAFKEGSAREEVYKFNTKDISFVVSLDGTEKQDVLQEQSESKANGQKSTISKRRKGKLDPFLTDESGKQPILASRNALVDLASLSAYAFSDQGHDVIKYCMPPKGASQGGPKLYDSRGFYYTLKPLTSNSEKEEYDPTTTWLCCSRTENYNCKARVIQKDLDFIVDKEHCHIPNKDKFIRALIRMEAIVLIQDPSNYSRSGKSIVKEVLNRYGSILKVDVNVDHLVRFVNYQKKSYMEEHALSTCRYTFNKKKIPKHFLLDKISTEYKLHLTLATEMQLAYLAAATEWYVDEADLSIAPFTSLFSIHVYYLREEEPRQMPVFFAILSDRREEDYSQVFASIKAALNTPLAVSSIVIDLNVPLRRSILKTFSDIEIKCCDRHWSEDISTKMREIDLSSFFDKPEFMSYLYQLPLLNLLPRQDFEMALTRIENEIQDESVRDLICYIRETFGERSLWAPKYWSAFKMPVQINKHELWRADILNYDAELDIYSFIRNLHLISKAVGYNLRLLSKKKLKRYYLTKPDSVPYKVYVQWKTYCKGEKDCYKLLDNLASVIRIF